MAAVIPAPRGERLSPITRFGALPVSAAALLPVLAWVLGGGLWYWATPVLLLGVAPFVDRLLGEDNANVPPALEARYERSLYYRATLWLYWPVQVGVVLLCYHLISSDSLALYEQIGLGFSMVVAVSLGATLGHELCHHPSRLDRFVGVQALSLCGMANFLIYHNYGHHNLVATPEDPASARFGQSFWSFTAGNIWKKFKLSWTIEAERLRRQGRGVLSPRNLMLWLTANELAWVVGLTWYFGPIALLLFPLHWIVPRFLLSVGDYLEHYGLARKKLPSGEYEPPRAIHSWDDSYMLSNFLFTVVDRHADHHENSGRPFQILRVRPEAPRLPYGYLTMVWIAFIPPLWRKLVDPIAIEHYRRSDVVPHALPGTLPADLARRAYVY
jgi:alkane 1-monooxygenase